MKRRRANETGMVAVVPVVAASLRFVLPSEVSVIRRLGDKSLAWLASLAPWTGAPGSHQRTWEEKDGAQPHQSVYIQSRFSYPSSESIRKDHFQPRYAGANLGHPSRGQGLVGSRESGGRKDSQPPNRAKVISLLTRSGGQTQPTRVSTPTQTAHLRSRSITKQIHRNEKQEKARTLRSALSG